MGSPGITIQVGGGASFSTRTDGDGFFTAVVGPNNGYIVTPSSPGLAFTPTTRSAIVTTVDVQDVDFTVDTGTQLASSILPTSRSVQGGHAASAFATLINTGATSASACSLAWPPGLPGKFLYQLTDPTTNLPVGAPNTPVNIGARAAQTFVLAFTPTDTLGPIEIAPVFSCSNTKPAMAVTGLNSLLLSASTMPVPDIVALSASGDPGIVDIVGATGAGAFAVATVNVGASTSITATADTGRARLPVSLSICQTNPTTGACLAAPASTVTTQINANATPTFGIFVTGKGPVPFDPANNRIFVRFKDGGGVTRGSTSVAVRTQ